MLPPQSLKARAKLCKDQYETKLAAWKRSLTPADIEHENAFRTAQRRSGKSRRKNIPDPNAPKRPMSAYLYFLQHIRADDGMSRDVFGDVTEFARQSVLAAAKWRGMTDEEKQVGCLFVFSMFFQFLTRIIAVFRSG